MVQAPMERMFFSKTDSPNIFALIRGFTAEEQRKTLWCLNLSYRPAADRRIFAQMQQTAMPAALKIKRPQLALRPKSREETPKEGYQMGKNSAPSDVC